jgi:hypothetical protein
MKLARLATAAALAGILALACGSAPTPAPEPRPPGPEAGGPAQGSFVDRGEETPLRHAYAVPVRSRKSKREEIHVVLSDRPLPPGVLDDLSRLSPIGEAGDLRAVDLVVDPQGKAIRMEFHHDRLPAGLSVTGAPKELRFSGLPEGPIEGSFAFDEPKEYSWSARGSFETPIYRPEERTVPQPSPDATPAERARATLEADGLAFSEELFLDRCFDGDLEAVTLFLEAGMSPNTRSGRGSALGDALSQKHLEVMKALLAAGADPNEKVDDYGTTLIHLAVDSGETPFVAALLEAKANPSVANQYRSTPLMSAALEGRLEMVRLLVAAGAKITARTTTGDTALSFAVFRKHLDVARLLIEAGSDVVRDRENLLAYAKRNKDKPMEKLIREAAKKGSPGKKK